MDNEMNALLWKAAEDGVISNVTQALDQGANVNSHNPAHQTALHVAAANGNSDVVKLLVEEYMADANCLDMHKQMPLHYACENNHSSVVKYLLSIGTVNPLAQDEDHKRPVDLIPPDSSMHTDIFAPLIDSSNKFPIESYCKVFVCGNVATGKSSLCQLIKFRSSAGPQHTFDPSHCVSVLPMTAGMELHNIDSWEVGHVVIHDFAGHPEYYNSHTAVLENLIIQSPAVFVLNINVTDSHNLIEKVLYYWLNFIENACGHIAKPSYIIVVGSHIDNLTCEDAADMESFINRVAARAVRKQHFQGYVGLDCRCPGGEHVARFISLLSESHHQVVDLSQSISFYCPVQYAFLRDLSQVAVTTGELCAKLKEQDHPLLPSDVSVVTDILINLSDRGLILFLQNSNWVIIDQSTLLKDVNATLFAPSSKRIYREIASNTGVITKSALKHTFPTYNIDMMVAFLSSLEFCHIIDSNTFKDISSNILPSISVVSGEILFFPSLISLDSPVCMSATPKFGYCLRCPDPYSFLSTDFVHVLLQHISLKYCLADEVELSTDPEAEKFKRVCDVWINGIHWSREDIEVLIEVSDLNRCITVLLSEKDGIEALKVYCSIIYEIHNLRRRLCPCPIKEYIITPDGLDDVQQVLVIKRQRINLDDVPSAVFLEEENVKDTSGKSIPVEHIINKKDTFYCLSSFPDVISKLFDDVQPLDEAVYQCIVDSCPEVMSDYNGSHVSSQSVLSHLNHYSIFGNFNSCQLNEIVKCCISKRLQEDHVDNAEDSAMANIVKLDAQVKEISLKQVSSMQQGDNEPAVIGFVNNLQDKDIAEEYDSKVDTLFSKVDCVQLHKAFNSGCVKAKFCRIIIQGPPGAGKTSIKSLVTHQPYENITKWSVDLPALPLGSICRYQQKTDSLYWELVDDDDKVLSCQVNCDHAIDMSTNTADKPKIAKANSVPTSETHADFKVSMSLPAGSHFDTSFNDITSKVDDTTTDVVKPDDDRDTQNSIKLELKANNETQSGASETIINGRNKIIDREWICFSDASPQIQFQQTFHNFLPCVSAIVLVKNMAQDFSISDGKELMVSDYTLSNEAALEQLIGMVNSNLQQLMALIASNPYLLEFIKLPKELQVIAIATHLDKLVEKPGDNLETVQHKLMDLAQSLKNNPSCPDISIEEFFYLVDGRKAKVGDFNDPKVAEIFQNLMKKEQIFEIAIPLNWYTFEIVLQKMAKKFHGVLPIDACYKIGQAIEQEMDSQEVKSALKFFHLFNTLLYYPDSEARNVVFAHTNFVYNVLSELAICIRKIRNGKKVGIDTVNMKEVVNGHISKEFILLSNVCESICLNIPDFKSILISLLVHLLLAVPQSDNKYFMPSILPLINPSEISQHSLCPFLFHFENGAPMSLFCTYIIYLLSRHSQPTRADWVIPAGISTHANCITLKRVGKCKVLFIGHHDKFEIHCNELKYRCEIKEELCQAMIDLIKERNIMMQPIGGLYCPCKLEEAIHVATFEKDEYSLYCHKSNEIIRYKEDNQMHSCWSWCKACTSQLSAFLCARPQLSDVTELLSSISYKWQVVADHLRICSSTIESLEKSDADNHIKMNCVIQKWMDMDGNATPVTWETISHVVHVLDDKKLLEEFSAASNIVYKEPQLRHLLELLSPIANEYKTIAVQLNITGYIPGVNDLDSPINNLISVLRQWYANGNSPEMNSPVKWKTIVDVIERRPIQNFELAEDIRKFLQKEDIYKLYMGNLSDDQKMEQEIIKEKYSCEKVIDCVEENETKETNVSQLEEEKEDIRDVNIDVKWNETVLEKAAKNMSYEDVAEFLEKEGFLHVAKKIQNNKDDGEIVFEVVKKCEVEELEELGLKTEVDRLRFCVLFKRHLSGKKSEIATMYAPKQLAESLNGIPQCKMFAQCFKDHKIDGEMLLEAKDGFFKELDIEFVNQEAIVTSFKKMIQESVNAVYDQSDPKDEFEDVLREAAKKMSCEDVVEFLEYEGFADVAQKVQDNKDNGEIVFEVIKKREVKELENLGLKTEVDRLRFCVLFKRHLFGKKSKIATMYGPKQLAEFSRGTAYGKMFAQSFEDYQIDGDMLLEAKDDFFRELDIETVNQEAIVTNFTKKIQESLNVEDMLREVAKNMSCEDVAQFLETEGFVDVAQKVRDNRDDGEVIYEVVTQSDMEELENLELKSEIDRLRFCVLFKRYLSGKKTEIATMYGPKQLAEFLQAIAHGKMYAQRFEDHKIDGEMLLEAKDGFFRELDIDYVNQEAILTNFKKRIQELTEVENMLDKAAKNMSYEDIAEFLENEGLVDVAKNVRDNKDEGEIIYEMVKQSDTEELAHLGLNTEVDRLRFCVLFKRQLFGKKSRTATIYGPKQLAEFLRGIEHGEMFAQSFEDHKIDGEMLLEAKDGFFRELKIESVHQEAIMTKFAQKMEDLAEVETVLEETAKKMSCEDVAHFLESEGFVDVAKQVRNNKDEGEIIYEMIKQCEMKELEDLGLKSEVDRLRFCVLFKRHLFGKKSNIATVYGPKQLAEFLNGIARGKKFAQSFEVLKIDGEMLLEANDGIFRELKIEHANQKAIVTKFKRKIKELVEVNFDEKVERVQAVEYMLDDAAKKMSYEDVAQFLEDEGFVDVANKVRDNKDDGEIVFEVVKTCDVEELEDLGLKTEIDRLRFCVLFKRKLSGKKSKIAAMCGPKQLAEFLLGKARGKKFAQSFDDHKIDGEMLLEAKDSFFRELQIEHVNQEAIVKYFRKKLQEMAEVEAILDEAAKKMSCEDVAMFLEEEGFVEVAKKVQDNKDDGEIVFEVIKKFEVDELEDLGLNTEVDRLRFCVLFKRKLSGNKSEIATVYGPKQLAEFLLGIARGKKFAQSFEDHKIDGEMLLEAGNGVFRELTIEHVNQEAIIKNFKIKLQELAEANLCQSRPEAQVLEEAAKNRSCEDVVHFLENEGFFDVAQKVQSNKDDGEVIYEVVKQSDIKELEDLGLKSEVDKLRFCVLFKRHLSGKTSKIATMYGPKQLAEFLQGIARGKKFAQSFEDHKIDGEMLLEATDSFFRELEIEIVNQQSIMNKFKKKLQEMVEDQNITEGQGETVLEYVETISYQDVAEFLENEEFIDVAITLRDNTVKRESIFEIVKRGDTEELEDLGLKSEVERLRFSVLFKRNVFGKKSDIATMYGPKELAEFLQGIARGKKFAQSFEDHKIDGEMLLEAKDSFFRELEIEPVNQEAIIKNFKKEVQELTEVQSGEEAQVKIALEQAAKNMSCDDIAQFLESEGFVDVAQKIRDNKDKVQSIFEFVKQWEIEELGDLGLKTEVDKLRFSVLFKRHLAGKKSEIATLYGPKQLAEFLRGIARGKKFAQSFEDHKIDGEMLLEAKDSFFRELDIEHVNQDAIIKHFKHEMNEANFDEVVVLEGKKAMPEMSEDMLKVKM